MSTICLSAGHNPTQQGASFEGFTEYLEAVEWVDLLHDILSENHTAVVVPTGSLKRKVKFINSVSPSLAVEIHFNSAVNAYGTHVGKGSETLYFPGSPMGRKLAETVQQTLSLCFPPDRGAKAGWYEMNPEKGPDYFLKATGCLAVIIEPDFVHRKGLIQANRVDGCKAIAEALEKALEDLKNA